jgi:hypothetical protein
MSVESAGTRAGAGLRRPLTALALLAGAALWLVAAARLWRTTVPSGLHLSGLDPRAYFSAGFLARSASYERFLAIDALLGAVVLLVVLALYARHGARLMRESAAGPIGTGMMLGMLGLGIAWIASCRSTSRACGGSAATASLIKATSRPWCRASSSWAGRSSRSRSRCS